MATQEMDLWLKISINLQGEIARKFEAIKKRYGFRSSTDLFRMLVSEKYEELFSTNSRASPQLQSTLIH